MSKLESNEDVKSSPDGICVDVRKSVPLDIKSINAPVILDNKLPFKVDVASAIKIDQTTPIKVEVQNGGQNPASPSTWKVSTIADDGTFRYGGNDFRVDKITGIVGNWVLVSGSSPSGGGAFSGLVNAGHSRIFIY